MDLALAQMKGTLENYRQTLVAEHERHLTAMENLEQDMAADLERQQRDRKANLDKLSAADERGAEIVKFNVGGKEFATTRKTLSGERAAGSLLQTMVETNLKPRADDRGALFIDRSPAAFKHVLAYLRDDPPPKLDPEEQGTLLRDADFYNLPQLVPWAAPVVRSCGPERFRQGTAGCQVAPDGQTAVTTKANAVLLGEISARSGVHKWAVEASGFSQFAVVRVGCCPSTATNPLDERLYLVHSPAMIHVQLNFDSGKVGVDLVERDGRACWRWVSINPGFVGQPLCIAFGCELAGMKFSLRSYEALGQPAPAAESPPAAAPVTQRPSKKAKPK